MCSGKRTTSAIADPHSQRRRASHYARTTRSGKLKNQNEKRQHFVYTFPPPLSPSSFISPLAKSNYCMCQQTQFERVLQMVAILWQGHVQGASQLAIGFFSRLCLCYCQQLFFIKRLSKVSLGGRVEKWANRKGSNETLMSY